MTIKQKIQSLLSAANETTGESDTDLTSAVSTLIDGYGQGGGSLQEKTATPTIAQQVITPDSGYDGLSKVTVNAMPTGSAGTPTATKGTVSNHQVSVTPNVTNTTGYITGGTKTGTAVTVKASDLVSGTLSVTSNGTKDVTNYASVNVNVPSVTPTGTINITQNGTYDVTNKASAVVNVSGGPSGPYTEETYGTYGDVISAVMHNNYPAVSAYKFYNYTKLASMTIPDSVYTIGEKAFYNCQKMVLNSTNYPTIDTIYAEAFYNCKMLTSFKCNGGITIGSNAFKNCTGLTEVILTMYSYMNDIATTAFTGCTKLTSIKVPWAEGDVSGAPWGATNATITYNYHG